MRKISYSKSGVNYNQLDPIKKMAQIAGFTTVKNIKANGIEELLQSRGESAYILESPDSYYVLVEEGLGTKNLVADEMYKITGKTYYDIIAQDTVAAIINDLITTGATPLTVLAYWAVGNSNWWKDTKRNKDLVNGWKQACNLSQAIWGGGETPSMSDVLKKDVCNLAGCAFGIIKPKEKITSGNKLEEGDVIIMFESSGIHANGLSLARKIAKELRNGYITKLPSGKLYGEELLKPTIIYTRLIQDLIKNNTDIHYMVNITGHGFRKLMRAQKSFTYIIDKIPPPSELFSFIQEKSGLSVFDMYSTFNMGAGFAIYVSNKYSETVMNISRKHNIKSWIAGKIEKGKKQVIIKPIDITYSEKDLNIR